MTEEIKEILDRFNKGHDELTVEEYILLENYIISLQQENKAKTHQIEVLEEIVNYERNIRNAKLQQDLDKANDTIEKDRQFYKCRMDEYAELKKENEKLKQTLHNITINGVEEENTTVLDLIKENKRLNNKIKEQNLLLIEFQDMEQKLKIKDNIINELEKYFEEKDNDGYEKLYVEDILYKLKELKESGNNE